MSISALTKTYRLTLSLILGLSLTLALLLLLLKPVQGGFLAHLLTPGNPTTDPFSNTHTVPVTTTVSITYDEAISATTVSAQTFAVQAMQTGLLQETFLVNGGTVTLSPTLPFKPGELIQVTATTGTLSTVDGTGPISPTVWQFRTGVDGGSGYFLPSSGMGNIDTGGLSLGDVNGDGYLDVFAVQLSNRFNLVWLNNGDGTFDNTGQTMGSENSNGVALGDLNGDGILDAYVVNSFGDPNEVWLGLGNGIFANTFQTLSSVFSYDVALGDVDGDGDLDAFVANLDTANTLWFNDGDGYFVDSGQIFTANEDTIDIELGDLDGDGDLDAFMGNCCDTLGNAVWLNDGTGVFNNTGQSLGSSRTEGVALGDLDNDGDLDAFTANDDGANYVWLNNGAGSFSSNLQSLGSSTSTSVDLGDLDGDGDLDAFIANLSDQANTVWLNDGGANFSQTSQFLGNQSSMDVVLGDLDNDGDLDAAVANAFGTNNTNEIWFNKNLVDLAISQTVTPNTLAPGELLTYTLVYTNYGPQVAVGISITDIIPNGITPLAYASNQTIIPTGNFSYTWELPDLIPNTGGVITITAMLDIGQAGDPFITNTTSISTTEADNIINNDEAQASITVINVPPVATDNITSTLEENALSGWLEATDDNGDPLTYSITTPTLTGTISLSDTNTGQFLYTPINLTSSYTDIFTFLVTDTSNLSDTATVTITVIADNDDPVALDDTQNIDESEIASATLTAYEPDADESIQSYGLDTPPTYGEATIDSSANWIYTPTNRMSSYTDLFIVTVSNNNSVNTTANITINVTAANEAPSVPDYTIAINETESASDTISVTDPDTDDSWQYDISTAPSNGTATVDSTGTWIYTATNQSASYSDVFIVTVIDNGGLTADATITATVTATNDIPSITEGENITVNMDEDSNPIPFNLTLNATDDDINDTLRWSSTTATNGTALVSGVGYTQTINYTPNPDYHGMDSFVVSVDDGNGDPASITVTVNIASQNDAPTAVDDSYTVLEDSNVTALDVLTNDTTLPDTGETLSIIEVGSLDNGGTAVITGDLGSSVFVGSVIHYQPAPNFNGTETFTYTIEDGNGGSDTAIVTINVTAVEDTPVATDETLTTDEDTPVNGTITATDPDVGDILSYVLSTAPTLGDLNFNSDGSWTYTPTNRTADYTDSFIVTVSDSASNSDTATITINVTADNDAPTAQNDSAGTGLGTPVSRVILASDPDVDDTLTYAVSSNPSQGEATINSSGTWIYTPTGTTSPYSDTFTLSVTDSGSNQANATININVVGASSLLISKMVVGEGGGITSLPLSSIITYTIKVSNTGTSPAVSIMLTDTLPAAITFGNWLTQDTAQEAGGTITWAGNIDVNASLTLEFNATIGTGTGLLGQAITNTVHFDSGNAASGNASASFSVGEGGSTEHIIYLPIVMKP